MAPADKLSEMREAALKLLAADHFAALKVPRSCPTDDVKRAFLEAAKTWHPDRVPTGMEELKPLYAKVFARLEAARSTLTDFQRRERYIQDLAKPSPAASASDVSTAEAQLELRKAEGLLKKNDAVEAEVHLRRALTLAPANAEVQVLLTWLSAKPDSPTARLEELITALDRITTANPTCERAFFYRGQLRKRVGKTEEAAADFARAASLNPQNLDAVREVRLYKMRQQRGTLSGSNTPAQAAPPTEPGAKGFFKKLFGK
jgi:curved DNA-binding protein CbpA